ncbi:FAD-dependent oxidoreductase [Falsiroseomonas sp. HW251]|uniref:FAD-dependent oxidoreductase n=1 Tax=Falsiroseomonas sp. HW251 TaxID=3390998 RepID=UPI003D31073A
MDRPLPDACDVLVVGAGAGGMAAAFTAAVGGLDVCLIEKEPVVGGSTALSGGVIWAPGNSIFAGKREADPAGSALTYLRAEAGNRLDEALAARFLAEAPRAIDFLVAQAGLRLVAPVYPDYHPDKAGWSAGGRAVRPAPFDGRRLGNDLALLRQPLPSMTLLGGMMVSAEDIVPLSQATRSPGAALVAARLVGRYAADRLRHGRATRLTNGNALVGALLHAVLTRGVRPHTGTTLREILLEGGRVMGAVVARDGATHRVRTRRGVVLATGGVPHDEALRADLGLAGAGPSLAPAGSTGDGVRAARLVGGAFRGAVASPVAWVPVSDVPSPGGGTTPHPHFFDRSKPGFIIVDRSGRRFASEALSYHDLGPLIAQRAGGEAFLIGDAPAVRRHGIGAARPWPAPNGGLLRAGYLVREATPQALAQRLGIDPDGFAGTLAEWNRHAPSGEDPAFGKGSDAYQRHIGETGHHPNPCVAPVAGPPFFAIRLRAGDIGTFVGLRTNHDAQVLRADGTPIEGLHAVGNDMASVMGGTYPGPGITLGPALTFGVLAGEFLAASPRSGGW